ncbi:hypothetical protein [Microbacterium aurantiacum]|nr:hypothetical protein [Microbacterium chocolatum]
MAPKGIADGYQRLGISKCDCNGDYDEPDDDDELGFSIVEVDD